MKEEYLNQVYEYMSKPRTAEELVDILSARGEVKSLFKSEDVDKYPVEAEETDGNLTEAVLSDPPIEKEPKKKPQGPSDARRRKRLADLEDIRSQSQHREHRRDNKTADSELGGALFLS